MWSVNLKYWERAFIKIHLTAEGMIRGRITDDLEKGGLLKNVLDYIKIERRRVRSASRVKGTMTSSPSVCYRGVHTVQCTGS